MSKLYGSNSVNELNQLTVNQGTWSMPYWDFLFFTIFLTLFLAVHGQVVGENQTLKHFNGLLSLR